MKMMHKISVVAALLFNCSPPVLASDHIDGPVTTKHRVADLSDLYLYPTPGKPGSITVILDTYPIVPVSGHFSEKVTYNLIFRRAEIKGSGDRAFFNTSDEVVISCTFVTPRNDEGHKATCTGSNGIVANVDYNTVADKGASDDFHLFAGMRSDPFFFNGSWAKSVVEKNKLPPPAGSNTMDWINVLSIVMDIELSKLFKGTPPTLIAIAAESTTKDRPEAPVRRLDRVGRPEITNVSLGVASVNKPEVRDQFNLDRPFQVLAANQANYKERLVKAIAYYDKLDGKKDWKDAEADSTAALLADDFLVMDVSKPCEAAAFLEIETSMLKHKPHETCGGRKPTDDIMDTLFTTYISGFGGKAVSDGADKPYKAILSTWPYLQDPDTDAISAGKAVLARLLLGVSAPPPPKHAHPPKKDHSH